MLAQLKVSNYGTEIMVVAADGVQLIVHTDEVEASLP